MNTEYWLSEARLLERYDLVDFASSVLQILFSTPREENWGVTVLFHFILSKIVAFGTGVSFLCFSGEPRKARSGGGGRVARVSRSTPDPHLSSLT